MNEDEKMFHIGVWALCVAAVLTVVLQVCYRTQNRELKHVRADIVSTNHQIAVNETKIEDYVSGTLRNSVTTNIPNAETIGFNKNVTINELADRK